LKTREKYKIYKPKKYLGQNFLVDDNISKKIVKQLEITKSDFVIEIGPGQGALTKHLEGYCDNYIAVEIDKSISEALEEKYGSRIKIINDDFLKYDLNQFVKPIKIIGNLPYNIASEILFKLFDYRDKIACAVLMVQKEFAQRLVAKPNTKEYGILSVQTNAFSQPKILFNVPPTVFFPKPKVESSVIKLEFKINYDILNKEIFKKLVRSSFGKRRKLIKNSLKDFFEEYKLSFRDYNFDFTKRAENINVEEYVKLSNDIYKIVLSYAK
jgi:16S rRNA (adenine1518-N6/adenine1519-N6)-dimethyltransferase